MEHTLGTHIDQFLVDAVAHCPLLIFGFELDGTVTFVNDAVVQRTQLPSHEWIGVSALDRLHPDDVDRAANGLATAIERETFPNPQRVTRYRAASRDGSWVPLEFNAAPVTHDGRLLLAAWARDATTDLTVESLLEGLTGDGPIDDVLRGVLDFVMWREWGSQVGLCWAQAGADHTVTTGLPAMLANGRDDDSPWDRARRTGLEQRLFTSELDESRKRAALDAGIAELQVVALDWGSNEPAIVSICTTADHRPEQHALGLFQVCTVGELALRWSAKTGDLERHARTDALTGLANRRTFFATIDEGPGPGAVLFCDLDGFKPVNDMLGHAAGDDVLRIVSKRLVDTARPGDLVARLGGDEFAVLCPGIDPDGAYAFAARLDQQIRAPIHVRSQEVSIGLSVGVGYDARAIDGHTVDLADRALYILKTHRWRRVRPTEDEHGVTER